MLGKPGLEHFTAPTLDADPVTELIVQPQDFVQFPKGRIILEFHPGIIQNADIRFIQLISVFTRGQRSGNSGYCFLPQRQRLLFLGKHNNHAACRRQRDRNNRPILFLDCRQLIAVTRLQIPQLRLIIAFNFQRDLLSGTNLVLVDQGHDLLSIQAPHLDHDATGRVNCHTFTARQLRPQLPDGFTQFLQWNLHSTGIIQQFPAVITRPAVNISRQRTRKNHLAAHFQEGFQQLKC